MGRDGAEHDALGHSSNVLACVSEERALSRTQKHKHATLGHVCNNSLSFVWHYWSRGRDAATTRGVHRAIVREEEEGRRKETHITRRDKLTIIHPH